MIEQRRAKYWVKEKLFAVSTSPAEGVPAYTGESDTSFPKFVSY